MQQRRKYNQNLKSSCTNGVSVCAIFVFILEMQQSLKEDRKIVVVFLLTGVVCFVFCTCVKGARTF